MKKFVKKVQEAKHYVGFKDSMQYNNAKKVFREPDFIHREWDKRAKQEFVQGDEVVFANGHETDDVGNYPSHDDSTDFAKDKKGRQPDHPKYMKEEAPANNVGSGNIAGMGVGPQGEPGMSMASMVRRRTFAGKTVFEVDPEYFYKARMGKKNEHRYEKYVGNDETGQAIRAYGRDRKNKGKPIVLQHRDTGAMMYLKYGGRKPH